MKGILLLLLFSILTAAASASEEEIKLKDYSGFEKHLTRSELLRFPMTEIKTDTEFSEEATFTGVKMKYIESLFPRKNLSMRVIASDDYSYSLPVSDFDKYDVILALKKNNKLLSYREFGPFIIIYPKNDNPDLNVPDTDAKIVWHVKEIISK